MLLSHALLAMAAALTGHLSPTSRPCRASLDFVIAKTETNYSGFRDKVGSSNQVEYGAHTAAARSQADTTSDDSACLLVLNNWLGFFHDHHIVVRAAPAGPAANIPPTIRRLSPRTLLPTLPRFNNEEGPLVLDLLHRHAHDLATADNLIVDVRMNGGGSDFVWLPVFHLLYTRPVVVINSSIYSTPDNIAKFENVLSDTGIPAADKADIRPLVDQLRDHPGEFVRRSDDMLRLDSAVAHPRRVAVVTAAGCQSSCEGFVLAARASGKTCVIGENTGRVLDYANQWHLAVPGSTFVLWYPTSRSQRLPQDPVDPNGIAPDVRMAVSGPDPAAHLRELIERGTKWPCHH
jgi:hypothetical protein